MDKHTVLPAELQHLRHEECAHLAFYMRLAADAIELAHTRLLLDDSCEFYKLSDGMRATLNAKISELEHRISAAKSAIKTFVDKLDKESM